MNLSISNIAWSSDNDELIYEMMKSLGFNGLEIAPTRLFPNAPYDHLDEAREWKERLFKKHGFKISSMQSIWFGRKELLFGSSEERRALIEYSKKAVLFANALGCKNLVFGCPRNRITSDSSDLQIAKDFFYEIGEFALKYDTAFGIEANPPLYNTNYLNDTKSAIELIEEVNSEGIKLNLDIGTMIENGESVSILQDKVHLINHVHVSEPYLKVIEQRKMHNDIAQALKTSCYNKFVSIEISKQEDVVLLKDVLVYVKSIFG